MAASLRAGLAAVAMDAQGVFVFLGNMPAIPHGLATRLAEKLETGADAVQPTYRGRPCHPLLLGRSLFEAAKTLKGEGVRSLLIDARVLRLAVDESSVTLDVDTPDDLARQAQTSKI